MTEVFTRERRPWAYHPIVPDILRTTQLPLPPPTSSNSLVKTERIRAFTRPARDAAYWAAQMQGLDFTRSDHADTVRFNHALWSGLRGDKWPYPAMRSGQNLRTNRKELLARAARRKIASVPEANPQWLLFCAKNLHGAKRIQRENETE